MGSTPKVFGTPLHPYTKTLLASIPQLHTKWVGESARLEEPAEPAGALVEVEDGHFVRSLEPASTE